MYKFREVTERMKVMHERVRERIFHVDSERSMIITEAEKRYEGVIPAIKNAMIFRDICEKMTTRVEPHEILVANNTKYFCGTRMDPRWGGDGDLYVGFVESGHWKKGEDGLYHNPETDELRLVMSEDEYQNLRSIRGYWKGRSIADIAKAWQPEGYD